MAERERGLVVVVSRVVHERDIFCVVVVCREMLLWWLVVWWMTERWSDGEAHEVSLKNREVLESAPCKLWSNFSRRIHRCFALARVGCSAVGLA